MYEYLKSNVNPELVKYCIDKFITAELDYTTKGNRGIGRFTDIVPRLGAYYRCGFSKLSNIQLDELADLIRDVILRSYIICESFQGNRDITLKRIDFEYIYSEWITNIYNINIDNAEPKLVDIMGICTQSAFDAITQFIKKHKLKKVDIFSQDKTPMILFWYPIAGFALRGIEIQEYLNNGETNGI